MAYSTSYSSSTQSGTSTSVTAEISMNDESTSSSIAVDMTTQTSSPDDSDGLAAIVGGSADALGDDTLAMGSISGELIDSGAVTSADLSATMVAASEDSDEPAIALTDTYAYVSGGTEVLFAYTVNTESSTQDTTGSTATSTSTTNLVAYDIDPEAGIDTADPVAGDDTADPVAEGSTADPVAEDDTADPVAEGSTADPVVSIATPTDVESDPGLDGNMASIEFDALVMGEDTLVLVDASVLALEGQLSSSDGMLVLAVE